MRQACDCLRSIIGLRHSVLRGRANHVSINQKFLQICRQPPVAGRASVQNFDGYGHIRDCPACSQPKPSAEFNWGSLQHCLGSCPSTADRVHHLVKWKRRHRLVCDLQELDNSADLSTRISNWRLRELVKHS